MEYLVELLLKSQKVGVRIIDPMWDPDKIKEPYFRKRVEFLVTHGLF